MFRSYFIGGFECATGYNQSHNWIDQVRATEHDKYIEADYARLRRTGITTVREGVRWPLVDKDGSYDLTTLRQILLAANNEGIEVLFDLFHYGYPKDLDIFSPTFADRFAGYCYQVAREVAHYSEGPHYFTPVNEPSYFAWAGGHVARFAPHQTDRGAELKYELVRAAIAGTNAIWSVVPEARIISIDPICSVVPASPEFQQAADDFNQRVVFESFDMLSGHLHPELGGSDRHLGIVGINYYWTNQWVLPTMAGMCPETLHADDPRRIPLRDLVRRVHERYRAPMLISETSHADSMRADWLVEVTSEIEALHLEGIELEGVCLYPILGMPEWHEPDVWVRLGLWDLYPDEYGKLIRHLHIPMFESLVECQSKIRKLVDRATVGEQI